MLISNLYLSNVPNCVNQDCSKVIVYMGNLFNRETMAHPLEGYPSLRGSSYLLTYFQLLAISGLSCGPENILV